MCCVQADRQATNVTNTTCQPATCLTNLVSILQLRVKTAANFLKQFTRTTNNLRLAGEELHEDRINGTGRRCCLGGHNLFNSLPRQLFCTRKILKIMTNSSFSSNHPGAIHPIFQMVLVQKRLAQQGIESILFPKQTFAFSSVCILHLQKSMIIKLFLGVKSTKRNDLANATNVVYKSIGGENTTSMVSNKIKNVLLLHF